MADEAIFLLAQAERCRRLADSIDDETARSALLKMVTEYEARAESLLHVKLPPQS